MAIQEGALDYAASPAWSKPAWQVRTPWLPITAGLVLNDAVALSASFSLAYQLRFRSGLPLLEVLPERADFYWSVTFWAVPLWLVTFALYRLYDRRLLFSGFQEYGRVIHASMIGVLIVVVVSFLDVTLIISRGWLLLTWGLAILTVCGSRFAVRRLLRELRSRGHLRVPTVIVGANGEARALAEQFLADRGSGLQIVGFVDGSMPKGTPVVGTIPVLGEIGDLTDLLQTVGASEVIVATTALGRDDLIELYRTVGRTRGIELRLSSGLFEVLTTGMSVQEISCVPLVTPQRVRITGTDAVLKGALDYLGGMVALLALSPLLLLIALLVKLDSPGPVLHRRRVVGRSGRVFDAFKFRTMVSDADRILATNEELRRSFESGFKLKDDPRVTRIGRFLRRTSLDELPQLVNVLRGEMSLVGPRMIVPDEAARYGKWQLNLLTVKPGITGPWQVQGRSDIPYEERVRLSMHYIRNWNIWMDLEILLRTVPAVLIGKGAY